MYNNKKKDVLRGAADEVLAILKNDGLKDIERKREIEGILSTLTADKFNQLVNLGKRVTDYAIGTEADAPASSKNEDAMDEDTGVAVIFDEESEDEEGGGFEIKGDTDDVWPSKKRNKGKPLLLNKKKK